MEIAEPTPKKARRPMTSDDDEDDIPLASKKVAQKSTTNCSTEKPRPGNYFHFCRSFQVK